MHLPDEIESCECTTNNPQRCQDCRDRYVWIEDDSLDVTNLWRDTTAEDPEIGERCVRVRNENEWAAQPCENQQRSICKAGIVTLI